MILIPLRDGERKAKTRSGKRVASLLLLGAAALLGASLLFPMWHIKLGAPQYPEGLGMYIWPNGIKGQSPNDLDIINGLNHYIGMKKIVPEDIPELRFIPKLMLLFAGLSAAIALWPTFWLIGILLVGYAGAGGLGMWDFWRWEYDYGHHLDPHAAINIPGMTYQPPLIGTAKLLNFTSQSWPALGGWMMFGSGLLMFLALWIVWPRRVGADGRPPLRHGLGLLIAVLMGCSSGPVPLQYGTDSCHFCQMKLAQKSFGAERITAKGKVYKFDSIECLLESLRQEGREGDRIYVVDFSRPGTLGPAESAIYLRAKGLQSPMGAGLAAFAGMDSAKACQARIGGEFVSFNDLLKS